MQLCNAGAAAQKVDHRHDLNSKRCTMQPRKFALTAPMAACSQSLPSCVAQRHGCRSLPAGMRLRQHWRTSAQMVGCFQRSFCSAALPGMSTFWNLLQAVSHDTSFASSHFWFCVAASGPWHQHDLMLVALVDIGGCAARLPSRFLSTCAGFAVAGELGRLGAAKAHAHGITARKCSCEADIQMSHNR